ncbi:MAG TPA: peptidyl-tRNA hydrolase Pth2 [Candidatus Dormibacteraeota bacterium]|nr:peptidyl-tRNA hydrolase Pth2 [Candidatus Dormibacteraeota bacterium]
MAYKLVIAVRTDLGMSVGKTAAQVAHAAVSAALSAAGTPDLPAWLADGQGKVVVRVGSLEALREKVEEARTSGLRATVIADAGRTELEPGTETCAAFGPADAEALAPVTGQLPLL